MSRKCIWRIITASIVVCLLSVILMRSKAEQLDYYGNIQFAGLVDEIDRISEDVEDAV